MGPGEGAGGSGGEESSDLGLGHGEDGGCDGGGELVAGLGVGGEAGDVEEGCDGAGGDRGGGRGRAGVVLGSAAKGNVFEL
jgi:hypothetical protein